MRETRQIFWPKMCWEIKTIELLLWFCITLIKCFFFYWFFIYAKKLFHFSLHLLTRYLPKTLDKIFISTIYYLSCKKLQSRLRKRQVKFWKRVKRKTMNFRRRYFGASEDETLKTQEDDILTGDANDVTFLSLVSIICQQGAILLTQNSNCSLLLEILLNTLQLVVVS